LVEVFDHSIAKYSTKRAKGFPGFHMKAATPFCYRNFRSRKRVEGQKAAKIVEILE